jgi:hypothetical protein
MPSQFTQDLATNIINGIFTAEEVAVLNNAIKFANSKIAKHNLAMVRCGDDVMFTSSLTGYTIKGKAARIKQKYIEVLDDNGTRYNVPAGMITKR